MKKQPASWNQNTAQEVPSSHSTSISSNIVVLLVLFSGEVLAAWSVAEPGSAVPSFAARLAHLGT